ncbi:hypothetical protein [Ruegeria lacuscaerulensis]|uniref:hypothetical protein n=1 Tax=Ruegeria lacuscaerulensis TaxID=55218 RepID=UPI00147E0941|nr:hypothetical protein [Ruegeria lacuscaerulensis]
MRQITTKSPGTCGETVSHFDTSETDLVFSTAPPGGIFGYYGPDVCFSQSVAVRFKVKAKVTLSKIGIWLMNNGEPGVPKIVISLREGSADDATPGEGAIEELPTVVSAVGWQPNLELVGATGTKVLRPEKKYWIVAESKTPCGESGVWTIASEGIGFSSNTWLGEWQPGGEGAIPALKVWGSPLPKDPFQ